MGDKKYYMKNNCVTCGAKIYNVSTRCKACSNKRNNRMRIGLSRPKEVGEKISKARRIEFNEEELARMKDMYVNKEISPPKISAHFNCSVSLIRRVLKENDVTMRNSSDSKIGNKNPFYGKRHDVKARKLISESKKGIASPKKITFNQTKVNEIINLYTINLLNTIDIGKKYNVSRAIIERILTENNKYMNPSERRKLLFSKNKIDSYWKGKHLSEESKKKMSDFRKGKTYEDLFGEERATKVKEKLAIANSGSKCSFWVDGKSMEPYDKKFSNRFKIAVRKRDNQICMVCNTHREKLKRALDVHHIDYDKLNTFSQNCISLCVSCHSKTNRNRKHWTTFFQSLLTEKYGYEYSKDNEIVLNIGEMQNG